MNFYIQKIKEKHYTDHKWDIIRSDLSLWKVNPSSYIKYNNKAEKENQCRTF